MSAAKQTTSCIATSEAEQNKSESHCETYKARRWNTKKRIKMNNILSKQQRAFFSFAQEACTLPLLAAQHVIHTRTPLKGLPCMLPGAAQSSMEISTFTSHFACMVLRQTAEAVVAAVLSNPELLLVIYNLWMIGEVHYITIQYTSGTLDNLTVLYGCLWCTARELSRWLQNLIWQWRVTWLCAHTAINCTNY